MRKVTDEVNIPILEQPIEDDTPELKIEKGKPSNTVILMWMGINVFSTIGVVFTNKAIFTDKNLVKMPVTFTAFHFLCTSLTLFTMAKLGKFVPKRIPLEEMLPLCFAFCGNVLLPNLSLAHSSVTFYQLCRILVTPGTAILNFFIYQVMISRNQALAIVPICLGIATTTYSDLSEKASDQTTSIIGVIFAFSGVIVSAIYVIWMGRYFKSFSVSSLQLLYNQAPISVILLFIFIPYIDTIPPLNEISTQQIGMIMLSGMFAILINMSQFYIVHGTSALTSTIVGHLKTCSIVTLGWVTGGTMRGMSVLGVAIAVIGIIQYSAVIHMQKAKLGNK